jgi:hypothetical protein
MTIDLIHMAAEAEKREEPDELVGEKSGEVDGCSEKGRIVPCLDP